jgi:hypothetical protein
MEVTKWVVGSLMFVVLVASWTLAIRDMVSWCDDPDEDVDED